MGACDFYDVAEGKDAEEAFLRAKDNAAWEHGHGGYTGTIAEKPWFVEFTVPQGLSAVEFEAAVMRLDFDEPFEASDQNQEATDLYRKVLAIPGAIDVVKKAHALADDKWADAVCVQDTGAVGTKVYRFFGWASS